MASMNKVHDGVSVVITAKPKRNHLNISQSGFRGSSYRGVSKNKSKWQVPISFFL